MANRFEPRALLEWARDLGRTTPFLDFHVHPFDVLTGEVTYHRNEQIEGVFSRGGSVYHPPLVDETIEIDEAHRASIPVTGRAFLLASRIKYAHTGPKVFADQIDAIGLSGILLLPVVGERAWARDMLGGGGRMV